MKISILTPTYNRVQLLEQAVRSVRREKGCVEHIIVDGGSTDGTLDVLQQYPGLRIDSRPDKGMYDALNRGLQLATGDVIGFLNSDDFLLPGALSHIFSEFEKCPDVAAVVGRAMYFWKTGRGWKRYMETDFWGDDDRRFWYALTYGEPSFNAWFFRREVFDAIGGFDPSFRIAGDREFLLRFAVAGFRSVQVDQFVYAYRAHRGSLTMSGDLRRFSRVADENLRIVELYGNQVPDFARPWMQKIIRRDTITAVSRSIRSGDWPSARKYAAIGWGEDKTWPVHFAARVVTGFGRALLRKLAYYPPV
jgi:glycosyltransferase involved in cell wall biosynthesis